MSVQTVRFRTTPELAPAVYEQIDAVFAAVAAAAFRSWLTSPTDDNVAPRSCTVIGRCSV